MAKRKAKQKAAKPQVVMSDHEKRDVASEGLLMTQSAAEIKAQDCAAFSVWMFNRDETPEEWKRMGATTTRIRRAIEQLEIAERILGDAEPIAIGTSFGEALSVSLRIEDFRRLFAGKPATRKSLVSWHWRCEVEGVVFGAVELTGEVTESVTV